MKCNSINASILITMKWDIKIKTLIMHFSFMRFLKTSYLLRYIKYLSNYTKNCGVISSKTHYIYKTAQAIQIQISCTFYAVLFDKHYNADQMYCNCSTSKLGIFEKQKFFNNSNMEAKIIYLLLYETAFCIFFFLDFQTKGEECGGGM